MPLTSNEDIEALLRATRTIAVIGASNKPERASYGVIAAVKSHGFRVLPVNPGLAGQEIHGATVFADLVTIGNPVDMVDIFRNSDAAGEAVDQAIAAGAKSVWMQLGVVNEAAAKRAEDAGLKVVMDRCLKLELARLGVSV